MVHAMALRVRSAAAVARSSASVTKKRPTSTLTGHKGSKGTGRARGGASKTGKVHPQRSREAKVASKGFKLIMGVDEAGRGPLAGPVVAAACFIPLDKYIDGVCDSKLLKSEDERESLYDVIINTPGVLWAVCIVGHEEIDASNILKCTLNAMASAAGDVCKKSAKEGAFVLVDGNQPPPLKCPGECVVGGDASVHCIGAASILAKVTRDRIMHGYDKKWPEYGFGKHKGYGTAAHVAAIARHGPCAIHRVTFAPIKGTDAAERILASRKKKSRSKSSKC